MCWRQVAVPSGPFLRTLTSGELVEEAEELRGPVVTGTGGTAYAEGDLCPEVRSSEGLCEEVRALLDTFGRRQG